MCFTVSIFSCFDQDWSWFEAVSKKFSISYSISLRNRVSGKSSSLNICGASAKAFCNYIFTPVEYANLKRKASSFEEKMIYDTFMTKRKYMGVFKKGDYWEAKIFSYHNYIIKCESEDEAAEWYDKMKLFLNNGLSYLNFPDRIGEFCRMDILPISEQLNSLSLKTKKFIFDSLSNLDIDNQDDLVKSEIINIVGGLR